jgi:hypothetical protein
LEAHVGRGLKGLCVELPVSFVHESSLPAASLVFVAGCSAVDAACCSGLSFWPFLLNSS